LSSFIIIIENCNITLKTLCHGCGFQLTASTFLTGNKVFHVQAGQDDERDREMAG